MKQDQDDFNQQASNRTPYQNSEFSEIISVIESFLNQSNRNENRRIIQSQQTGNLVPFQMPMQFPQFSLINPFNVPLLIIPYNVQTRNFSMLSNVNNNIINHNNMPSTPRCIESDEKNSSESDTDADSDSNSDTDSDSDSDSERETEAIIESPKDRNDRLTFALGVTSYNEKNGTNIINEILHGCFDFLPLKEIGVVRRANKECCLIMNELLKQSMKTVIIGTCCNKPTFPKNERSFSLNFDSSKKNKDTNETIEHKVNFIKTTTLNTTFIFFEIHMYKFSPMFLEKILKAFSDPKVCTQLKNVVCLISRVHSKKGSIFEYINPLLELSKKTLKNNSIDYTFMFQPDAYEKSYKKTVEKQLKEIKFPENKNYSLNLDIPSQDVFKEIPSSKKFISQPDTQKIINTQLCTDDNVNTFITDIYSKISQKNAREAHIKCNEITEITSLVDLTQAFLNEKLYPSLEKLHISNFYEDNEENSRSHIEQKNNATIKEIFFDNCRRISTEFLEFCLNSCTKLNSLIIDEPQSQIFSDLFLKKGATFKLENLIIRKNIINNNNNRGDFSIQNLKEMVLHFPYIKNLFLENIFLGYNNGTNEIDQFIALVQNFAWHIPDIHFKASFTKALHKQIKVHVEQFKKDLDQLKKTLQAKDHYVEISINKDLYGVSITIIKNN